MRTLPALVGRIRRFYLYGDHNGEDVFATGGEIEFMQVWLISIYFPIVDLCIKYSALRK